MTRRPPSGGPRAAPQARPAARLGRLRPGCWLLPAWLLWPMAAWSHAFWMVPYGPFVEPGARVALDLRIGPRWPGESTPRLPGLVRTFRVIDAQGSRDVAGRSGATPVGHFDARSAGAAVVAMETNASSIKLDGAQFQAYLREEHLDEALKQRESLGLSDADAREDFFRAAKTLVIVGGDSRGFDRVVGQPIELVPVTDPARYRPGQPFDVRLLREGRPAQHVRIAALPQSAPEKVLEANTGANGVARFTLPSAGQWTFYAVQIEPAARPSADWQSTWASLTLAIGEVPR